MSIRVRKLARELGRSDGEVLGILHHLGFHRYTKPDDMVNDRIAAKARKAARDGVRVAPVVVEAPVSASRAPAAKAAPSALDAMMAELVPGVVPQGRPAAAVVPAGPTIAPPEPEPAPVPDPEPPAPEPVDAPRVQELEARVAALEEELAAACATRDALQAAVERAPEATTVGQVLTQRGLRGSDERQRAIEALAAYRALDDVLTFTQLDPGGLVALERALQQLILLDGPVPEGFKGAAVAVSPDRAEAPGADTLGRLASKVGEQMLLNGYRRLRFVGVGPRWHGALRGRLDRRLDVHFVPGGPRDAARAADDAEGVDVVCYADTAVADDARATSLAAVHVVEGPEALGPLLEALVASLLPDG